MNQIRINAGSFALIFVSIFLFASSGRAEHMLVLGDSQGCGAFGQNFVKNLSSQGHNVTLYCMPSSTPKNWLRQTLPAGQKCKVLTSKDSAFKLCGGDGNPPSIDELLKNPKVNRVIVELGGNSLASPRPDSSYVDLAQKIFKSEKSCDWLGPAWRQPEKSKSNKDNLERSNQNIPLFVKTLARQIGPYCTFIDSKDATGPGELGNETVDGVHRTETAGKIWAQSIADRYKISSPIAPTNKGAR